MTESEQAAAILAAINAAIGPGATAYEYDKIPGANGNAGTEPAQYVAIALSRRYVDERRYDGSVMLPGGRLEASFIGKSIVNVRNMQRLTTGAIEDVILTGPGGEVGPFVFESSEAIKPDGAYQVGRDVWTF